MDIFSAPSRVSPKRLQKTNTHHTHTKTKEKHRRLTGGGRHSKQCTHLHSLYKHSTTNPHTTYITKKLAAVVNRGGGGSILITPKLPPHLWRYTHIHTHARVLLGLPGHTTSLWCIQVQPILSEPSHWGMFEVEIPMSVRVNTYFFTRKGLELRHVHTGYFVFGDR